MANECLVTKLKGVVDNNNLERLGEIVISGRSGINNRFKNTENATVRIISGTITTDHALVDGEIIPPGDHWLFMTDGASVGLTPRYTMTEIRDKADLSARFSKYAYMNDLVHLDTTASGDASVLKNCHLTYFMQSGANSPILNMFEGLSGSKTSLTTLGFYDNSQTVLTAAQLGQFINVTEATFIGSSCTGNMEDYFAVIRPLKPSGSITISYGTGLNYQNRGLADWRSIEGQGATKIRFTWTEGVTDPVIDFPS